MILSHDHLDVGLRERGQVVVGDQDPLAAREVVRGQLRPQLRVGHLTTKMRLTGLAKRRCQRDPQHRDRKRLARPVDRRAHQTLQHRKPPVGRSLEAADPPIAARHHPGRGALEQVQARDQGLDLRNDLDRTGAGADHGHPLAAEVVVVVPGGGVKHGPFELTQTRDLRQLRLVQGPGRSDQVAGDDRPARGLEPPAPGVRVPACPLDLAPEPDPVADSLLDRDASEVVADLALSGEGRRPVRVGGEGERIDVAGNVAATSGVGVLPPRPPHLVRPLEDDEIVATGAQQPAGDREPGETAPDDRDLDRARNRDASGLGRSRLVRLGDRHVAPSIRCAPSGTSYGAVTYTGVR